MTTPTIRAALERLIELEDAASANGADPDMTAWNDAVATGRAAAWLRENPPGQQVAIEPRGCPTPRACSCVEPAPPAPQAGEGEAP